jgi:flagellar motor switch protein FliN
MMPESPTSTEVKESPQAASEVSPVLSVAQEPESLAPPESDRASLSVLAAKLPLQLDLRVPLPSFRVQNLLSLEKGQVIESAWPHTEDLPLWSGGVHLVWTEFEVVDQKLAVRVTRLV